MPDKMSTISMSGLTEFYLKQQMKADAKVPGKLRPKWLGLGKTR